MKRVLFVLLLAANGCAVVPQNRRGKLADPMMSLDDATMDARRKQKLYTTREAAAGGDGAPAGGRLRLSMSPHAARRRRVEGRTPRALALVVLVLLFATLARIARADDATDPDARPYFRVESAVVRSTILEQHGHGFQSRAGPLGGPGDESLFVFEPEIETVIAQGEHVTHTVHIPIDVVTAASPDAIDVMTSASKNNEAVAIDWTATYKADTTQLGVRSLFHGEENYRSWLEGLTLSRSFADENTVLGASVFSALDYFEKYKITGPKFGHGSRSAINVNASLTQVLSTTTVAALSVGYTAQSGFLASPINIVPVTDGTDVFEHLPPLRNRYAIAGRVAQYLPWSGALKASYRFYADDWGTTAHTLEGELDQRLASFAYVGATYRYHEQSGVSYFTTLARPDFTYATADSDLAPFHAQTLGGKFGLDYKTRSAIGSALHVDLEFEHYFRSNDLRVNVLSCSVGFLR